jgi:hypothetical protein
MTQITIPDVPTFIEYSVVTASTGPFTVPFAFFDQDDVQATVTDAIGTITNLVVATDFTFTTLDTPVGQEGNGYSGGAITLNSSIGADAATTLRVFRETIVDRTSNFPSTGPFSMPILNDEQNRQTMMMQERVLDLQELEQNISDNEANAIRSPDGGSMELPSVLSRGDKYVRFTTAGDVEVAEVTASTTILSQSVIAGFLYPQSPAELAAGVTPTNMEYCYGNPHRYNAVGDGVTNDIDAFQELSLVINQQGGGLVFFEPGSNYIVGRQTFTGVADGRAYSLETNLFFDGCTKTVVVEGNGCTIKMADGLKHGAFDPVTGLAFASVAPFTDLNYRSDPGYTIYARDCTSVVIRNLEVDGNIQNIDLGGPWGDTGYQCIAYGIAVSECDDVTVDNCWTHHHALDGVYVKYISLVETDEATPVTLRNVKSEYNARQGLSWTGGIGLTAINCKFNHTGRSTFSSQPGAGVDIEAESSICRNGMFINCEFIDNAGAGMVADQGDSADVAFHRCKFQGTTVYAIWPKKPRFSFTDCLIIGQYVNPYNSTTIPEDATRFTRCVFTDEAKYGTVYGGSMLCLTTFQYNVVYTDCTWNNTEVKVGRLDNATIIRGTFNISAGITYVANQDWQLILWKGTWDNVTINDNITALEQPTDAYYIGLNDNETFRGYNVVNSTNQKVKWKNWNSQGYVGPVWNSDLTFNAIKVGSTNNHSRMTAFTAPAATGTWKQGSIVWNTGAVAAGQVGWVCISSGTYSAATDSTGITDGSTPVITGLTDTSDFAVGDIVYVSAGFFSSTFGYEIMELTATTMTLNGNSNSAQVGVTVDTPDPVWKTFGTIAA